MTDDVLPVGPLPEDVDVPTAGFMFIANDDSTVFKNGFWTLDG